MKEKLSPMSRAIGLRQLRALRAVVEAGTISGAARALHLTAPAVGLQLRQLESLCRLPLTERRADGLVPTPAGLELLRAQARIDGALADCTAALAALGSVEEGRAAVGVVSTAKYFAPFALAAFRRGHPGIDLGLTIGNRAMTIEALRQYDLDFAIMGRPPDDLPVVAEKIGDHPHVVIAPPDHRLARGRWSLRALATETFLMREPGSGTRALAARLFAEAGITPRIGMAIDSNETIKQAVMAGLGIALLSAHTTAAELADGRLVALDIDGLPAMREWFVVRHAEKRLLPAAAALWRFLADEGAAYLPILPATRSRGTEPDRCGITAHGPGS
jgi:LysR family transcriptional regulator, low CO2-responsive transcriptional regulator